jgi:hypothetical protein
MSKFQEIIRERKIQKFMETQEFLALGYCTIAKQVITN